MIVLGGTAASHTSLAWGAAIFSHKIGRQNDEALTKNHQTGNAIETHEHTGDFKES
jgi:hypothetical protein